MVGENLDLTSEPGDSKPRAGNASNKEGETGGARPFVGVTFNCCSVYSRIYRTRDGKAYAGNCPKCSNPVRLVIGAGGSNSRFYTAY